MKSASFALILPCALALAAASACTAFDNGSTGTGGHGSGSGAGVGGGGTQGLPCDVSQVLQARCLSCHGTPPVGAAPMSLDTYAALTAPSSVDASQTYAQRAVARMQDAAKPMPPVPASRSTPDEIAVLQAWIDAGYPMGTCSSMTACSTPADCAPGQICQASACIDPLDAAPACTTNQYSYAHEGYDMAPGGPCTTCHMQHAGGFEHPPYFSFAGTVYPTGHEPEYCMATPEVGQATVVIVDANGTEALRLTPNAVGTFASTFGVAMPYTAKIVYQGRERVMTTPQTSGDCNVCHTDKGANPSDPMNLAPGRITLP